MFAYCNGLLPFQADTDPGAFQAPGVWSTTVEGNSPPVGVVGLIAKPLGFGSGGSGSSLVSQSAGGRSLTP